MASSTQRRALVAVFISAGRLRRQIGGLFEAHGLSSSQYNILRILRGAGEPLPTMTIRDRMMDPQPSITRLIDRLEGRGLVKRRPLADDRRRVDCEITQAGVALIEELEGPLDAMDRELMSRLDRKELATLTRLLDKVGDPE